MDRLDQMSQEDSLPPDEIARRMDAAVRRALRTPPQPKHGKVKESSLSKGRDRASVAKPRKRGQAAVES
jgi:hypothetical protein